MTLPKPWLYRYLLRSTSVYGLREGDLVSYSYSGVTRLGLVVRTKHRAPMFISSKGNRLISIVELEKPEGPEFQAMIESLYLNRAACADSECLKQFFTQQEFKYFKLTGIRKVRALDNLELIQS